VFAINPANDTQLAQYQQNAVNPGAAVTTTGASGASSASTSATNTLNPACDSYCSYAFSTAHVIPAFLVTVLVGSVGCLIL